jgi:hemolysin III
MEWLHFRHPVSAWTHLIWMFLAIPATYLLWQRSRGDRAKQVSLLIFGLGAIACFGASAVYHAVQVPAAAGQPLRWFEVSRSQLEWFITGDYIGIHLLIAATCTGVAFSLLPGRWKWTMLSTIWAITVAAIIARLSFDNLPRWLNPVVYLVLGWALAASHPSLVRAVSSGPVRWVWLGGFLYTLGAMCYLTRWPVLWDGVFGAHELLHIFVMAGSLAHFWFILKYVIPFDRSQLRAGNRQTVRFAGNQTAPVSV